MDGGRLGSREPEGKGNDGVTALTRSTFHTREQLCFEIVGVRVELACGDLLRGCAVEAKFANAEAALGAYRWSEYAAGHRTRCVQIASASLRIKHRARFVIGIICEILATLSEYSCGRASRKASAQTADSSTDAPAHPLRPLGIMLLQFGQTFL